MKKYIIKFISLSIFLGSSFIATSQNADKILEELSNKTNSYENIKTSFSYNMVNTEAEINEVTNGTLLVEGDKYNLNIAGQIVISDGKTLWTYIPDSEEVQVNELSEESGFSPSKLLSSYHKDYKAKMMDDLTIDGKAFYQLNLKPIDKNSNFNYVVLVVNKELMQLKEFIMHDFDDNVFSYEIKQFVTNSDIPGNSFSFDEKDYPNVEVIDMR